MMASKENIYEAELRWMDCDPPDWLVGGGVLYKPGWNHLRGYAEIS